MTKQNKAELIESFQDLQKAKASFFLAIADHLINGNEVEAMGLLMEAFIKMFQSYTLDSYVGGLEEDYILENFNCIIEKITDDVIEHFHSQKTNPVTMNMRNTGAIKAQKAPMDNGPIGNA